MASTWAKATLRSVVLFTPVVLAVEDMLVSVEVVKGDSMSPEVQHGDVVLVDKLSPRLSLFPRGAVAALWSPEDPHARLLKRLVALEGDWLAVPGREEFVRLPKGRCWVEGDNRRDSVDSASRFGPVPLALVRGYAMAVCWPPSRVGAVRERPPVGRVIKMNDPIALATERPDCY